MKLQPVWQRLDAELDCRATHSVAEEVTATFDDNASSSSSAVPTLDSLPARNSVPDALWPSLAARHAAYSSSGNQQALLQDLSQVRCVCLLPSATKRGRLATCLVPAASSCQPVVHSPHLSLARWAGMTCLMHVFCPLTQVYVILFGVGSTDTEGIYSLRVMSRDDGLPQDTIIAFSCKEDADRCAVATCIS